MLRVAFSRRGSSLRHRSLFVAVGVLPDLGDGGCEEEFDRLFVRRADDVESNRPQDLSRLDHRERPLPFLLHLVDEFVATVQQGDCIPF